MEKIKSSSHILHVFITLLVLIVMLLVISFRDINNLNKENSKLKLKVVSLTAEKNDFIKKHTQGIDTVFIAGLKPEDVHTIINAERQKAGLALLKYDIKLELSACAKADDMIEKDYWAHDSPNGIKPWKFIRDQAVFYREAGENLGYGFISGDDLVDGWMASEGHRKNIMKESYTHEGLCFRVSENFHGDGRQTIVVQHFTKQW